MNFINAILEALAMAGAMAWEILWPLILGFALSGIVQALVRREQVTRLLSGDSPRALAAATALGAASSSCSYAAVVIARSLFRKGASFASSMAFEIASTNLVIELGIILALLIGWQFTLAEFIGGPVMIIFVALGFRLWMRGRVVDAAREQADKAIAGSMEGHAAMDIGPVIAMLSFVCSIGNVPLAAVLWNGGISFGGVASFIFADLIVIPIILIYRKYYGFKAALRITGIFYLAMVAVGYIVEVLFSITGLVPRERSAIVLEGSVSWNYTTWLNILFLALAAILVTRFVRNGGTRMLKMMGGSPDAHEHHDHA